MKFLPILFQEDLVRKILSGDKSQTRRMVRLHLPGIWFVKNFRRVKFWIDSATDYIMADCPKIKEGPIRSDAFTKIMTTKAGQKLRARYAPGDYLWVRETWGTDNGIVCFRTGEIINGNWVFPILPQGSWKPSIHLRRQDARIFLKVISTRLEFLTDITEEEAKAEGMAMLAEQESDGKPYVIPKDPYREAFFNKWTAIHGKRRGHRIQDDPLILVVNFKEVNRADLPKEFKELLEAK